MHRIFIKCAKASHRGKGLENYPCPNVFPLGLQCGLSCFQNITLKNGLHCRAGKFDDIAIGFRVYAYS